MTISDVVNGMVDEETNVTIWRRDGYALCAVAKGTIGYLKKDYPWNVVLWGKEVTDVELTDGGHGVRLVIV